MDRKFISRLGGRIVGFCGLLVIVSGVCFCVLALVAIFTGAQLLDVIPVLGVGLFVLLVGRWLFVLGRRVAQPDVQERVKRDNRPAVLLLRAFRTDGRVAERNWFKQASLMSPALGRQGLEERLAQIMEDVGPPIALGRPGEILPSLGFSRQYVAMDAWQDTLRSHFSNVSWIVFLVTETTPHLEWEIQAALSHADRPNILVVLPDQTKMKTSGAEVAGYISSHFDVPADLVDLRTAALIFPVRSAPYRVTYPSDDRSTEAQLHAIQAELVRSCVVNGIYAGPMSIGAKPSEIVSMLKLLPLIALFFGAAMSFQIYAVSRDILTTLVVAAVVGGVFALAMLSFVVLVKSLRAFGLKDRGGWLDGEIIVHSGMANLTINGLAEGGMLYLTNMRLRFAAHRAGAFAADHSYGLRTIEGVELRRSLGLIPNQVALRLWGGRTAAFVVHAREGWATAIRRVMATVV
jgi:hypothetical protein